MCQRRYDKFRSGAQPRYFVVRRVRVQHVLKTTEFPAYFCLCAKRRCLEQLDRKLWKPIIERLQWFEWRQLPPARAEPSGLSAASR